MGKTTDFTAMQAPKSEFINGKVFVVETQQPLSDDAVVKVQEIQEYLLKQVGQKIQLTQADGTSRIQLQLEPQELGKLTLRLVSQNGQVSLKIFAQSSMTKELVEQNILNLKQNFENQGIKCAEIEVSIGNGGDQNFFGQQSNPPFQQQSKQADKRGALGTKDKVVAFTGFIRDEIEEGRAGIKMMQSRMEFLA